MRGVVPVNSVSQVNPINEEAYRIAERIFSERENFDAREVFLSAVGVEEVMRLARQRAELEAMRRVPAVIKALTHLAVAEGDVRAARTLLEAAGVLGTKLPPQQAAFVNQINISPQELVELEKGLRERGVINAREE